MRSFHHYRTGDFANHKAIQALEKLQFVNLDENIEDYFIRGKEHLDVDQNALTVVEAAGATNDDDELISRVLWDTS